MVTGSIKDAKITFPYDLRSDEITNNKLNAGESAKIAKGTYVAEDIIVSVKKSSGTDAKNILKGNSITIDDVKINGTMPNNGALSGALDAGESFTIPAGYTSGGTVTANSLASQTSATATGTDILSGKTAWINGNKVTGNIPSLVAKTYIPSTKDQTISAEQYLSGTQTIKGDADLISANIKSGTEIFGVKGDSSIISSTKIINAINAKLSGLSVSASEEEIAAYITANWQGGNSTGNVEYIYHDHTVKPCVYHKATLCGGKRWYSKDGGQTEPHVILNCSKCGNVGGWQTTIPADEFGPYGNGTADPCDKVLAPAYWECGKTENTIEQAIITWD